jgi:hypothetical protein
MRKRAASVVFGVSCVLAGLAGAIAGNTAVAEVIGKVTQPLVAGKIVSAQEQQNQVLVGVRIKTATCSGTLLNNEWAITAAHCFEGKNATAADLELIANWTAKQTRGAKEFHILPNDIALVRAATPFNGVGADLAPPAEEPAPPPVEEAKAPPVEQPAPPPMEEAAVLPADDAAPPAQDFVEVKLAVDVYRVPGGNGASRRAARRNEEGRAGQALQRELVPCEMAEGRGLGL